MRRSASSRTYVEVRAMPDLTRPPFTGTYRVHGDAVRDCQARFGDEWQRIALLGGKAGLRRSKPPRGRRSASGSARNGTRGPACDLLGDSRDRPVSPRAAGCATIGR
jgi:hypothetical protein